ncbi:hypothetical protein PUN28_015261 [Cardiocondyla obscurior]|uniref:Uncharacterized protein n=1 Tax=Cardiocondyla obscurior TaxID=286306 RepID=A0AAW2F0F5_9HYME
MTELGMAKPKPSPQRCRLETSQSSFSCAKHRLVCNNVQCASLRIIIHRATHHKTQRFVFSATHPEHPRRVQHAKNLLEDITLQHEAC